MSNPHPPPTFRFVLDGKEYTTDRRHMTGAEIKAFVGLDPSYQLYEEGQGNSPDRVISDGETVSFEGHEKRFYAVPPATFGNR